MTGVACASTTMTLSSPTITPELGSPSAVNAYRPGPISSNETVFSAVSAADAKALLLMNTRSHGACSHQSGIWQQRQPNLERLQTRGQSQAQSSFSPGPADRKPVARGTIFRHP